MWTLPWLSVALCVGAGADAAAATEPPVLAAARQVVAWLDGGDLDPFTERLSPAMRKALPKERLRSMSEGLRASKGSPVRLEPAPGGSERSGTVRVVGQKGEWLLTLTLDASGVILGLSVTEPPAPEPPLARNEVPLRLPFDGAWAVVWGGPTLAQNQHLTQPSQRRAVDALVLDDAGVSHRSDGSRNEHFYAYGQPLRAVADGTVVTVVDGVPDNPPGEMNRLFVPGNVVVVRHGPTLYSAYAHLIPGSAAVRVGQAVKAGAVIGRCGNSGNSSEAHLHFQLQDGPRFEKSWGVEPHFRDVRVVRDGGEETVADYTWLKGDLVLAPSGPPSGR